MPLNETYNEMLTVIANHPARPYVEPFNHVQMVEDLRLANRPAGQVKLLLLAESHVRAPDDLAGGIGFVYAPTYYTPWWHDLFLPAFGAASKARATKATRAEYLNRMKRAGFWLLDASLLALSSYRNVKYPVSRPFNERQVKALIRISWQQHVSHHYQEVMQQAQPPVVVAYQSVIAHIPEIDHVSTIVPDYRLVFNGPSNSKKYRQAGYCGGTKTFCQAAERAGLQRCLQILGPPR